MTVIFLKLAAKVAGRMKAACKADLLKREICFAQQSARGLEAILYQRFNGRASYICVKASPRFASADVGCFGNIFECDVFGVMIVDIGEHLLDSDLCGDLYAGGLHLLQSIEIPKYAFKNESEIALNGHLVAFAFVLHFSVDLFNESIDLAVLFVFIFEHNEGQCITGGDRLDVFLIYRADL